MNVYAVITARAGSQRVPGKNRELLPYTLSFLDQALDADMWGYPHVILSTDDDELAASFSVFKFKKWVRPLVVRRPAELATGASRRMHIHAIAHALDAVNFGRRPGTGVLLQPTSPFRSKDDFHQIINTLAVAEPSWVGSIQTVKGEIKRAPMIDALPEENGNLYGFRWPPIVAGDWLRAEPRCYLPQGQRESFQVDTPEDMEMFRKLTA